MRLGLCCFALGLASPVPAWAAFVPSEAAAAMPPAAAAATAGDREAVDLYGVKVTLRLGKGLSADQVAGVERIIREGREETLPVNILYKVTCQTGYQDLFNEAHRPRGAAAHDAAGTPDKAVEPVSMLSGCLDPRCPLNIHDRGGYRRIFTASLLEELQGVPAWRGKELTYLSLGSGSLFEDFNLINELMKAGYNIARVVLIDKDYSGPRGLLAHLLPHDTGRMPEKEQMAETIVSDGPVRGVVDWTMYHYYVEASHTFLDQFVRWFGTAKPGFQVYVYANVDRYLMDCKEVPALRWNLGLAVDIIESNSVANLTSTLMPVVNALWEPFYVRAKEHPDDVEKKGAAPPDAMFFVLNDPLKIQMDTIKHAEWPRLMWWVEAGEREVAARLLRLETRK